MTAFDVELVGKIGSMALINKEYNDIDYNIIARISRELRPGCFWVTSGATEIGRLDYLHRVGNELSGDYNDIKTDYSAQGQAILMETYRRFVDSRFSLRQFLVEHQHFNDEMKREHLRAALMRCPKQGAIPIINYNDPVCSEENRKMEIQALRSVHEKVVECIDNDETAGQIACLVKPKYLLILTGVNGIYTDIRDESTLVREITADNVEELNEKIEYYEGYCNGASRRGANGAAAKLNYIKEPARMGTTVFIANSKFGIKAVLEGNAPSTKICLKK